MNKYIAILFSALFLISLISCENSKTENSLSSEDEKQNEAAKKRSEAAKKDSLFLKKNVKTIKEEEHYISFEEQDGFSYTFSRKGNEGPYTSLSFGQHSSELFASSKQPELHEFIKNLSFYWDYVEKSDSINLNSLGLSSPHNYPDIAKNQVMAFKRDEEWNSTENTGIKNTKTLMLSTTYKMTAEIMLRQDVYKPVNDFLKQKGFEISGFDVEKMGGISEEVQKEMGVKKPVLVPSPLMIMIYVEKSKG
jgi:hypothetical protein